MTERPEPGEAVEIEPGITRVVAPNASPMTFWGTNSYILGDEDCVVVDPGPIDKAHHSALLAATRGRRVVAIFITHAHLDHSALAVSFAKTRVAPICAFGPATAGRSPAMERLAATGKAGGGEGMDRDFVPDRMIADGEVFEIGAHKIRALHTPGHFPGHMTFEYDDVLLSGDHIMGWSTTLISPPDGDLGAFYASCATLAQLNHRLYLPGHGPPVTEPQALIADQVAHRRARGDQIQEALRERPGTPDELASRIYTDIDPKLLPAAARNVLAHLIELCELGVVDADPELGFGARFRMV